MYSRKLLLRFKDACVVRPEGLDDLTVRSVRGGGGGGGRGEKQWEKGTPQKGGGGDRGRDDRNGNNNNGGGGGGGGWERGQKQAPPPKGNSNNRGGGGGGGNNRNYDNYTEDGLPVVPLTKSSNRWMPQPNEDGIMILEKKIKGILNKMTKEKVSEAMDNANNSPLPN